ncbi:MAG: hypothetical protein NTZ85_11975 [Bacteroidia bacterium]|jgi:hypothetical protein|nr:hypothetical protein [Bacteroidia bacterium]
MKPSVKISLFVVFFLALSGILIALYLFNMQHKDLQKVKPDFIISAVDLQKAFEENETSAASTYVNKVLEVTGTIESVKTGENNVLSIVLKTGSDLSTVICTFPPETDPAKFTSGKQITVRGECSGFLMDVLLNNCVTL